MNMFYGVVQDNCNVAILIKSLLLTLVKPIGQQWNRFRSK